MKVKVLVIATLLGSVGVSAVGDANPRPALSIFLPRAMRVTSETLTLGQIAVVFSRDTALGDKASAVAMGRAPWSKEKIVIDRRTILSRLASSGIAAGTVKLTGARAVAVTRNDVSIPSQKVLATAEGFLRKGHPCPEGCTWRLTGKVAGLVVPAAKGVTLKAGLADGAPKGTIRVRVSARRGKRELGGTTVSFRLVYLTRQAVAAVAIPAGGVLTKKNTKIVTIFADRPPRRVWTSPLGMVVTHALPAGAVIRPSLLRPASRDVIVKRNQTVVMKIEGLCFTITGLGLALQNGRAGEYIKVRNMDSKRIVVALVAHDGSVHPVYNGAKK